MVIDSRGHQDERGVMRRRYCPKCEERFTTHELTDQMALEYGKKLVRFDVLMALNGVFSSRKPANG